ETLDLGYLFSILKKHLVIIIIVGIISGAAGFSGAYFLIPKKYESKALLYVENSQQNTDTVNINDITAAQKLVNTCQIIFKSGAIMDNLIANLNLPYTKDELDEMIVASSVNGTEVMELCVECGSPQEAEQIVNEWVDLSKQEFSRIIKSGSIEVVDFGEVNTTPSFPNVPLVTVAIFVLGIVISYIIVFLNDMFDIAIKQDDNLVQIYDVPVFAEINDFEIVSNAKYGYGYGKKPKQKTQHENNAGMSERFITEDTPFAIVEAYNTARTNTMFAVSTGKSKIIAVTISNPSEGKSTTCANFAISFANAGNKVLLVECDLRKPTVAKNFAIKPKNGLSSILGGFCSVNDAINADVLSNLDIITAGDIPPNPSELLGSQAMRTFLAASSEIYDYVFLDTPPVNVVTDSQLMNDVIAGIVFVVKEKSTTHPDIQSALDKIRLANGKVLGFVKTFGSVGKKGRYGKKYAYKDYKYGYSAQNNK
ncbi:MAG: polysaccharide biosynthesis tyrosine autokinase, partial [Oscillospiraceae bacterium]|nr:polysaccharide biosynthesis tyrosine autokinase [Oscillospiraceae bacterium]